MAEILLKAMDATHPDTEKDRRGCYKKGAPVVVMPDGHAWGAKEVWPTFTVIKVPGVSVAKVEKYALPETEEALGRQIIPLEEWQRKLLEGNFIGFLSQPTTIREFGIDGVIHVELEGMQRKIYRRRKWQIQWNELPQGAKDKLIATGELTIKAGSYSGAFDYTWAQVKNFFLNHTTGLRETADI